MWDTFEICAKFLRTALRGVLLPEHLGRG